MLDDPGIFTGALQAATVFLPHLEIFCVILYFEI